jgi:hypothetical protein
VRNCGAERSCQHLLWLNGTVHLLSCELALGAPDMPSSALEKLQSAHELVKNLRSQLESSLVEA